MARWSEWVELPDGTRAIVCHSGSRPKASPCVRCGTTSTKQCDFPLPGGKTCDAYLCRGCARPQGPNRDYCPSHLREPDLAD